MKNGGLATLIGTGSFFRLGTRWFLVSARHVFVSCFRTPSGFLVANSNDCDLLVPVEGGSIAVGGTVHHSEGFDDVAILALSDEVVARLRARWTPITMDMVEPPRAPARAGQFFLVGFPLAAMALGAASQQGMRTLEGQPFAFMGTWDSDTLCAADTATEEIPFDPERHLLLDLDRPLAIGEVRNLFGAALGGVSGTPVWRVDGSGVRFRYQLAGIQTCAPVAHPRRFVRATRWWVVRELLRQFDRTLLEASETVVGFQ